MQRASKRSVIGIFIDAVDYDSAVEFVLRAAEAKRGAAISAVAVHGLMTGVLDREQKFRLNRFDLLVPDGHPVRWALNLLHHEKLSDRVYGPNLTLRICQRAAAGGLPVYFYGSTPEILAALRPALEKQCPGLHIAGMEPSRFRRLSPNEKEALVTRIRQSEAAITFVGLGCPRQEVFAFEFREILGMPILSVGAAFPFLAGMVPQAPAWMQDSGLEWLFRLATEPRRLWRRYVYLNPAYIFLVALQALRISQFETEERRPIGEVLYG
jgi:N-acetylglucosaminyldiphosphoundecaprenol N-acetyl-beta-D-mannosaminyltransferase